MTKKSANSNLHKAKDSKKDEFYTQLADISEELKHYKEHFRGKVVYCNCDDPRISNFFHYFSYNFETLGLKKLIATCYKNQDMDLFSQHNSEQAIYLEYNGDKNNNRVPDPKEIGVKHLKGDGDFRSKECIKLLKEADIVVTNPPFSLFREYVDQLVEYKKEFLIIGNKNCITYKEVFKLIKEEKMWLGYRNINADMWFELPETSEKWEKIQNGKKVQHIMGCWFTNLDHSKRHVDHDTGKTYTPEKYPKYDNYDAINVDKVVDIPMDYAGAMGVPITFLDKYNPEQFEILGLGISNSGIEAGVRPYKPEHKEYRKEVQKRGAVDGDLYMITNGVVDVPYARILIKNKRLCKSNSKK